MGSSPSTHLFYGYVWDGETSIRSLLYPDDAFSEDAEDMDEHQSDDWVEVLMRRRGITSPYDNYPSREELIAIGRSATTEQFNDAVAKRGIFNPKQDDYTFERVGGHVYGQRPEVEAASSAWWETKRAVEKEFNCDLTSYGAIGDGYTTAYLYVKSAPDVTRSYRSSWDGPTRVHSSVLHGADFEQMDAWLQEFIDALDLPMGKPEYGNPPVGPGWFMVSSYG